MEGHLEDAGEVGALFVNYMRYLSGTEILQQPISINLNADRKLGVVKDTITILAPYERRDIGAYMIPRNVSKFRESCRVIYYTLTYSLTIDRDALNRLKDTVSIICS